MKQLCLRWYLCLVILVLLPINLAAIPVHAQEGPVDFAGFQPSSGLPNTEMVPTLFGSGFDVIEDMGFIIDDVDVFDWVIESNEVIRVGIFIPADTPPGPKRVEINYLVDNTPFQTILDDGFEVLTPEFPPFVDSMQLFGVEPPDGFPGTEMDITLMGEGFEPAEDFDVIIEGVDILGREIESSEVVRARIFIPEDAPPGPRLVEIVVLREDQPISAALEEGFFVQAQEGDGNGIPWLWIVLVFVAGGLGFIIGRVIPNKPPQPPPPPPSEIYFIREIEPGSQSIEPANQSIKVDIDVRLITTIEESKIAIQPEHESIIAESRPL